MKQKLIAVVLVGCVAAVYYGVLAEDAQTTVVAVPAANHVLHQPAAVTVQLGEAHAYQLIDASAQPPRSPLQNRYVQLADAYSRLMTEEELQEEIARVEAAIALRNSERQLDAVRESLQELIEEYPDSETARRAKRMLDASGKTAIQTFEESRTRRRRVEPSPFDRDQTDYEPSPNR